MQIGARVRQSWLFFETQSIYDMNFKAHIVVGNTDTNYHFNK